MDGDGLERARSLIESPAPAVLTTYRRDGAAQVSPVWFRWAGGWFEVVIATGDAKLGHLRRDPRCVLVVFETVAPFRGVEVRGTAQLIETEVTALRAAIAGKYLGAAAGDRFAESRRAIPGVVLRLPGAGARVWDLAAII